MESIIVLHIWAITGRRGVLLGFFCCLLFLNVAATLSVYISIFPVTAPLYNWLHMLSFELIVFLTAAFYGVRGVKRREF
ncbi:hypothetical protein ARMGADRAFT_1016850 [Armillaria gallica]|uniref:Uncharacterized protein n=1 Tax=Armillaria gallica TaxID=47427 RepID=A0A2H3D6Q5_ARMGA|nr:hypothetical protein ARMGADRAFT_1016850 [Armillaria gallica]